MYILLLSEFYSVFNQHQILMNWEFENWIGLKVTSNKNKDTSISNHLLSNPSLILSIKSKQGLEIKPVVGSPVLVLRAQIRIEAGVFEEESSERKTTKMLVSCSIGILEYTYLAFHALFLLPGFLWINLGQWMFATWLLESSDFSRGVWRLPCGYSFSWQLRHFSGDSLFQVTLRRFDNSDVTSHGIPCGYHMHLPTWECFSCGKTNPNIYYLWNVSHFFFNISLSFFLLYKFGYNT